MDGQMKLEDAALIEDFADDSSDPVDLGLD